MDEVPFENNNTKNLPDRIADTFSGKNVLITGGSGFLGKVLVEKFLRCCPDIDTIYLLIRTKKGKDPKQRLEEIFQSQLFNKVKEQIGGQKAVLRKVKSVAGDVSELNLGLSEEDRKEIGERVNFIYHCAATIRFDEALKKAVLLNTRGTKLMLQLAQECKNLIMFAHVSTAYCHLHQKLLLEKCYDPPTDPHNIIKCCEWMDEEIVDSIKDKLLGNLPNTYAFTKALGEGLVNEQMDNLPVVIFRPSIVIPVWRDPLPGWTDNINGPTGLLIGAGKGVIRSMYCDEQGYADYLPVDVAVNGLLVGTWNFVKNEKHKRIYHLTSSSEIKITWRELIELGRKIVQDKMPLNGVVWYPGGSMKSSRLHHNICVILFHLIPALFLDTLLFILGYKPVLCKVQRRINKGFEVLEYYANNQWDFVNDNAVDVRKKLNDREKVTYKIDGDGLDMEEYFLHCTHAARLYILKETDETLPAARRHMQIMWWVDKITKLLFAYFFIWFFTKMLFPDFELSSLVSIFS